MNGLQIFNNEEFGQVRIFEIDNEPWFVGKDISDALGYRMASDMARNIDDDDKDTHDVRTLGGTQKMLIINESGFYAAILGSRLEGAKKFKHWVTREVLPSIRKTGSYNLPKTYKEALAQLLVQVEENEKLALENEEMKPKVEFYNAVADSKDAITMNDVAKVLGIQGYGRNNLFEFLRNNNVLMADNRPYQRYIDNGWFRTVEQKYSKGVDVCINIKTLVFQKGIDGIRRMIEKKEKENELQIQTIG